MPRYVAFLRAVNVGGRMVKMDELRRLFAAAGFANVETFIASGNVIFDARAKPGAALEAKIEGMLKKTLGYDVPTFVRPLADVVTAAERALFPEKDVVRRRCAAGRPAQAAGRPGRAEASRCAQSRAAHLKIAGNELYWLCKVKQSETRLPPAEIERALGGPTTMRSMVSIGKLAAKHCKGT